MSGFFSSLAIRVIPYPKRMPKFINEALSYWWFYHNTLSGAQKYHDRRLKELDPAYRLREAQHDLVWQREVARKNGIGPDSPDYPTLDTEELLR